MTDVIGDYYASRVEEGRVRLPSRFVYDHQLRCNYTVGSVSRANLRSAYATYSYTAPELANLVSDCELYTDAGMAREYYSEGYGGLVASARAVLRALDKAGLLPIAEGGREEWGRLEREYDEEQARWRAEVARQRAEAARPNGPEEVTS